MRMRPSKRLLSLTVLALASVACGDHGGGNTDAAATDGQQQDGAVVDAAMADAPIDVPVDAATVVVEHGARVSCDDVCASEGKACVAADATPKHYYLCTGSVQISLTSRPCAAVPTPTYESGSIACNFWYVACTCG